MNEKEIQEITRPVWYGREANSPELPEGQLGIEFSTADANGPFGDTIGLYATVRIGGIQAEIYGGRANAATEVVALDAESGMVYHSPAKRIDSVPFRPVSGLPQDQASTDAVLDEIESNFNVDLCVHLGLPPEYAQYHVFCWMDHVTSDIQVIDTPAANERDELGKPLTRPCASEVVSISTQAGILPQGIQGVFLASTVEKKAAEEASKEEKIREGVVVQGNVSSELLPAEPPLPDDVPLYLTVMVRSFVDRKFKWCSVHIPESCLESRSLSFNIKPFYLLDLPETPQRIFVLAAVGSTISNIFTIEAEDYLNL